MAQLALFEVLPFESFEDTILEASRDQTRRQASWRKDLTQDL